MHPIPSDSVLQDERDALRPGHYRRQMADFPRSGYWGREGCKCGGGTLVAEVGPDLLRLYPRLCDRWACPHCGVRRAAWLKRMVGAAMEAYGLRYFVTLTLRSRELPGGGYVGHAPAASHAFITKAFNRLLSRIRKRVPVLYVWTRETTRRGVAHLHLLWDLDLVALVRGDNELWLDLLADDPRLATLGDEALPGAILAALWRDASEGSWIVDVEPVESDRACNYLAKYVSKEAPERALNPDLRKKRLFSKARGVQFEPFRGKSESPLAWQVWAKGYWEACAQLRANGAEVRSGGATPSAAVVGAGPLVGAVPLLLVANADPSFEFEPPGVEGDGFEAVGEAAQVASAL